MHSECTLCKQWSCSTIPKNLREKTLSIDYKLIILTNFTYDINSKPFSPIYLIKLEYKESIYPVL